MKSVAFCQSLLLIILFISLSTCSQLIDLIKSGVDQRYIVEYLGTPRGLTEIESCTWFYEKTPLMLASQAGLTLVVEALLKRHASVMATDRFGMDSLMLASKYGNLDAAVALLNGGAYLYRAHEQSNYSPITYAAKYCKLDLVNFYLQFDSASNIHYYDEHLYDAAIKAQESSCSSAADIIFSYSPGAFFIHNHEKMMQRLTIAILVAQVAKGAYNTYNLLEEIRQRNELNARTYKVNK